MKVTDYKSIKTGIPPMELNEATYWGKLYQSTKPKDFSQKMEINGALACMHPGISMLAMNRIIGWGWHPSENEDHLLRFIDFFLTRGCTRFMIQVSPYAPDYRQLRQLLINQGFRLHNRLAKLSRSAKDDIPVVHGSLSIRKLLKEEAHIYGEIIKSSFQWDYDGLESWLGNSVELDGYQHYVVCYDGHQIAVGALHISGEYAHMAFAGTLKEYRGLGAQKLLLAHRLSEARSLGAKWVYSETAEDRADRPVISFRNMIKCGFQCEYLRENWVYESE